MLLSQIMSYQVQTNCHAGTGGKQEMLLPEGAVVTVPSPAAAPSGDNSLDFLLYQIGFALSVQRVLHARVYISLLSHLILSHLIKVVTRI